MYVRGDIMLLLDCQSAHTAWIGVHAEREVIVRVVPTRLHP